MKTLGYGIERNRILRFVGLDITYWRRSKGWSLELGLWWVTLWVSKPPGGQ